MQHIILLNFISSIAANVLKGCTVMTKNMKKIELSKNALYEFVDIYKRRQQSEERRVCPLQTFCRIVGGFFQMRTSEAFVENDFRNL